MVLRLIPPSWLRDLDPTVCVREGEFSDVEWQEYNAKGYNVYWLPNGPSRHVKGVTVDGSQIDVFNYVFVDFDLKSGGYGNSKEVFHRHVQSLRIPPTSIVDSGGGVHAYWRVSDLDAMSYLRLSRRLMRLLNTDEAVGQIFQLMRLPGSLNVKEAGNPRTCEVLESNDSVYTCEQLDSALPPITNADEEYCKQHYAKTYRTKEDTQVNDRLPVKFATLMRESKEVQAIWKGEGSADRSKSDMRLGHLLFASGFTKDEALSVLVNCAKALERAPVHRVGYAESIVEKIWTSEETKNTDGLSEGVDTILGAAGKDVMGTRFPCHPCFDNTVVGFRLGHVVGLVAGSGVGKTTVAMNMFKWFVERNPEYVHVFVSLEQPKNEIAARWNTVCQGDTRLHSKVRILSGYNEDGSNRSLSLEDIRNHIVGLQKTIKIGTVVIDHVGVLRTQNKNGENQGLVEVFKSMKAFAIATNTLVIMQSQAPREKAGIGDIELNKDAAYGGVQFESYCDWLFTVWQPLKRCYSKGAPTVLAYKLCKNRHKKQGKDRIQEDVRYMLYFNSETEQLREMTEKEHKSVAYYNQQAVKLRKEDKKTELIEYTSLKSEGGIVDSADNNQDSRRPESTTRLRH